MQVSHVNGLHGKVPRGEQSTKRADVQFNGEACSSRQLIQDANKRSLGFLDMVNILPPNMGAKFLKLKWRKFDHLASEVGGARNIFSELFGKNKAENTFWLDSSSTEKVSLLLSEIPCEQTLQFSFTYSFYPFCYSGNEFM